MTGQDIIWTNAGILLFGPWFVHSNMNRNLYIFIQENAFEYVVWKMAVILSWLECVNYFTMKARLRMLFSSLWYLILSYLSLKRLSLNKSLFPRARNFKGTLWNSTQNILPIHWKIRFVYSVGILRALGFRSSYVFWNTLPGGVSKTIMSP